MHYYDLDIAIDFNKPFDEIEKNILFYKELGYYGVGIDTPLNKLEMFEELKNKLEDKNFKLYSRINIKSKNIPGLKKALKNMRRKYDCIGIESWDINVCHWAIQDSRPDIIILNKYGFKNYEYSTAKLIRNNNKAIEISLTKLLHSQFDYRSKLLRIYSKKLLSFLKANTPFLLTTHSKNYSIYDIRAPRDIISLVILLDIPEDTARKAIISYPEQIIENALAKKDPNIISDNIKVIERDDENQ